MKNLYEILVVQIVFLVSSIHAQHGFHTDGIEPYYKTKPLNNYLKKIDSSYLPYMFASEEDMQWWKEAKFGVFVHWAPAAVTEAALSWGRLGPRPHHSSDGSVKKGVPEQEYNDTYKIFNPTKFDAEKWVRIFKESGAKYFVFTAKHHYGFCMWDTKTTDFQIMNTPYGKDVMAEIAEACEKYDMKLMWYYSQPDWTHPLYKKELPINKYNEKILYPQLRELMSYPGVDGIWFDGLGKSSEMWDSPKTLKIIRDVNPKAIVNHRHGSPQWHMGDFDGPERGVGRFQTNRPWETCDVLGGAWAYNGESKPASKSEVIKVISKIAGNGGNLLLGTGPRPDGTIVDKHIERLNDIGDYLNIYGEGIYETQGGPYISGPWGAATYKENKVYLHLMGKLIGKKLVLPKLPAKIVSYKTLTENEEVTVKNLEEGLEITFVQELNPISTIVELTIDVQAKDIEAIKTKGRLLFNGATIVSSSNKSEEYAATNLLPGASKDFSEGIRVKKSWRPENNDEKPFIVYSWKSPQNIKQISIKEGRKLGVSKIKNFEIKAFVNEQWKTVCKGKDVGSFFGVHFCEALKTNKIKIQFLEQTEVEINKVLMYSDL